MWTFPNGFTPTRILTGSYCLFPVSQKEETKAQSRQITQSKSLTMTLGSTRMSEATAGLDSTKHVV